MHASFFFFIFCCAFFISVVTKQWRNIVGGVKNLTSNLGYKHFRARMRARVKQIIGCCLSNEELLKTNLTVYEFFFTPADFFKV